LSVVDAAALVELESDWSPVELLVELESDWSPVVADVLLLSDWSPVVVALSMVRLERPRRSMFGAKVEVEPVTEFVLSAVDPVIDDCELAVEPVTAALVPAVALFDEPVFRPAVPAWLSGMQSWWTGLEECSLAMPVDLSASLPALGLFSWLHSGFAVAVGVGVAFVVLVALGMVEAFGELELIALLLVWASAGVAARTAAAISWCSRDRIAVDGIATK